MINNGKALERAIELIESHILSKFPDKKNIQATVETNKIVIENDVRHEIDIYVKIDLGIGTDLIYIFECKNWEKQVVSKNDVIIFNEKITVTNAQKGYFIARNFGRDAENKAKQYDRVEILKFKDDSLYGTKNFIDISYCVVSDLSGNFILHGLKQIDASNYSTLLIETNGEKVPLGQFAWRVVYEYFMDIERKIKNVEIIIDKEYYKELKFSFLKPKINDSIIEKLDIMAMVTLEVREPVLIYDFDIDKKGGYVKIRTETIMGDNNIIHEMTKVGKEINYHKMYLEEKSPIVQNSLK